MQRAHVARHLVGTPAAMAVYAAWDSWIVVLQSSFNRAPQECASWHRRRVLCISQARTRGNFTTQERVRLGHKDKRQSKRTGGARCGAKRRQELEQLEEQLQQPCLHTKGVTGSWSNSAWTSTRRQSQRQVRPPKVHQNAPQSGGTRTCQGRCASQAACSEGLYFAPLLPSLQHKVIFRQAVVKRTST